MKKYIKLIKHIREKVCCKTRKIRPKITYKQILYLHEKEEKMAKTANVRTTKTPSLAASIGEQIDNYPELEVTIARKMLPHPKGSKATCAIC